MKVYTIYKATNSINGKSYIGFDSNYPARRKDHEKPSKNKKIKDKADNNYFHNAINFYGKENFEWSILYQSYDKDHTLNEMETHFINEYRTYIGFSDCNGYNRTLGGEATFGKVHSEEWRKNHSNIMKGRKFTEDHKNNLSKSLKGKKRTEETKKKISEIKRGINNWQIRRKDIIPHPRSKKYIGISPIGLVKFFCGLNRFCEKNNLSTRSVSLCAKGERDSTKGWKFYEYDEALYIILKQYEEIKYED